MTAPERSRATAPRLLIRSRPRRPSREVISSVSPSERYASSVSADLLFRYSTATLGGAPGSETGLPAAAATGFDVSRTARRRLAPQIAPRMATTTPVAASTLALGRRRRSRGRPLVTPGAAGCGERASCAPLAARTAAWSSARASSVAVAKRSAGNVAIAMPAMRSTSGSTVGRASRRLGARSVKRRAMIACTVGPVNGGAPASISYSTHPNE